MVPKVLTNVDFIKQFMMIRLDINLRKTNKIDGYITIFNIFMICNNIVN